MSDTSMFAAPDVPQGGPPDPNAGVPIAPLMQVKGTLRVAVPVVNLLAELAMAALGAFVAGLSTLAGTLTQTNATDFHALKAGFVSAGITAVVFFSTSLRSWFQQKYGTLV